MRDPKTKGAGKNAKRLSAQTLIVMLAALSWTSMTRSWMRKLGTRAADWKRPMTKKRPRTEKNWAEQLEGQ